MKCPNCGGENCQIINEISTEGTNYDVANGCCGAILLGPLGLLCGLNGAGKQTVNTNYWVCNRCGYKWKA